jgi:ankyrin repeat protein
MLWYIVFSTPKESNNMDNTAVLIEAVTQNNSKRVLKLLKNGLSPNCYEDKAKLTPLHFTVLYQAVECAQILLTAGASPLAHDAENETPLKLARELGDKKMLSLLKKF